MRRLLLRLFPANAHLRAPQRQMPLMFSLRAKLPVARPGLIRLPRLLQTRAAQARLSLVRVLPIPGWLVSRRH